jgi:hypothetical protein
VDWEGALITQALYDARSASNKFIPVLFDSDSERYIPEPLRSKTCYTLITEADYQSLYDALLNQSGVEPGAIGVLKRKPRATGTPLRFDAQPAEITAYLHELIHNQYSRHDQRYVALEAKARRSSSLERAMDTVIDTDVILRDFNLEAETAHDRPQEKHYDDALEAYRALKNKPVRRLAVLGEPGAPASPFRCSVLPWNMPDRLCKTPLRRYRCWCRWVSGRRKTCRYLCLSSRNWDRLAAISPRCAISDAPC